MSEECVVDPELVGQSAERFCRTHGRLALVCDLYQELDHLKASNKRLQDAIKGIIPSLSNKQVSELWWLLGGLHSPTSAGTGGGKDMQATPRAESVTLPESASPADAAKVAGSIPTPSPKAEAGDAPCEHIDWRHWQVRGVWFHFMPDPAVSGRVIGFTMSECPGPKRDAEAERRGFPPVGTFALRAHLELHDGKFSEAEAGDVPRCGWCTPQWNPHWFADKYGGICVTFVDPASKNPVHTVENPAEWTKCSGPKPKAEGVDPHCPLCECLCGCACEMVRCRECGCGPKREAEGRS